MKFRNPFCRLLCVCGLSFGLAALAGCNGGSTDTPTKRDAAMATPSGPTSTAQLKPPVQVAATLNEAVLGHWRTEAYLSSDPYRNPEKTFTFFGITPSSRVIDLAPSSGYYSEILAPLLATSGSYTIALPEGEISAALRTEIARLPSTYGSIRILEYAPASPQLGPAASADIVLAFSDIDRWVADGSVDEIFRATYESLKPGGVFAVLQPRDNSVDGRKEGYLSEQEVIFQAELAGFALTEWSEFNANPKDTRDHPGGARALPPIFVNGEDRRDAYTTIGEPDRMTLKFVKQDES